MCEVCGSAVRKIHTAGRCMMPMVLQAAMPASAACLLCASPPPCLLPHNFQLSSAQLCMHCPPLRTRTSSRLPPAAVAKKGGGGREVRGVAEIHTVGLNAGALQPTQVPTCMAQARNISEARGWPWSVN